MTLDDVPFAKLLGIELDSLEPGHAVLLMPMRDELKRNGGIAHGGAIATLIDSAMAFAIVPMLAEDERSITVDLTIHYLRPVSEGTARASARVVRAGKRVITVSAELFDSQEKLAATAISTYLRLSV
ncbi:MAG TPA: PaaI family thioesterase [Pyrinomonadaceae bacterium]|nr:PaaI family thioesterase [Pyrinomonadaceae bacterium]